MATWRKFSSQADPQLLKGLQEIAARDGRLFQAVLADAMRDYLTRKRRQTTPQSVGDSVEENLEEHVDAYRAPVKPVLRVRRRSPDSPAPNQVPLPAPTAPLIDVVALLLDERQNHR